MNIEYENMVCNEIMTCIGLHEMLQFVYLDAADCFRSSKKFKMVSCPIEYRRRLFHYSMTGFLIFYMYAVNIICYLLNYIYYNKARR